MTFKYNNVYINSTGTVIGPYEAKGPFSKLYDKKYNDFYFGAKTWEQAETKSIKDVVDITLAKINKQPSEINLHLGGDLLNQLVANNYAAALIKIPFLGIYSACATSTAGLIIASNHIEAKQINNAIITVSSHNNSAEKQFRYPVEYGGPKRKTTTFTSTGATCAYLSSEKGDIKIESGTIGKVVDMGIKDVYHMGAVMAPAAAEVIYTHLKETKREADYYDLILTGDLGKYGKTILQEYLKTAYNLELSNYEDAACIIYNKNQPVYAGASGAACLPLVAYTHVFDLMKRKELKRVLLVATGALMSQSTVSQKLTLPSIAHAVSVEVNE